MFKGSQLKKYCLFEKKTYVDFIDIYLEAVFFLQNYKYILRYD